MKKPRCLLVRAVLPALASVLLSATAPSVRAQTPAFGNPSLVMTSAQTQAAGINFYDGTFGISAYSATEFTFYHTWFTDTVKMRGSTSFPAQTIVWKKSYTNLWNMNGFKGIPWITALYTAASPSLDRWGFIHVEYAGPSGASGPQWPGALGIGYSADGGSTFKYAGDSIRLDYTVANPNNPGGAQYANDGTYCYIYYKENYCRAVARCLMSTVLSEAKAGRAPVFKKFYNGAWNEPGMGGRASDNGIGSLVGTGHGDVAWNTYLNKFVYLAVDSISDGSKLVLLTSPSATGPWTKFTANNPDGAAGGALHYATMAPLLGNNDNGQQADNRFYAFCSQHKVGQASGDRLWKWFVQFP